MSGPWLAPKLKECAVELEFWTLALIIGGSVVAAMIEGIVSLLR